MGSQTRLSRRPGRERYKMKKSEPVVPWWATLLTGITLIVIPEPATTGLGILIVAGTVGVKGYEAITDGKRK